MGGRALLVAAVACVTAAGIASIAWTHGKTARPTVPAAAMPAVVEPSELRALQHQVQALRAEVATRNAQPSEVAAPAAAPIASAAPAEAAAVLTPDEAHALKRLELNNRVESEAIDRNWSHDTEQKIDAAFRGSIAPGTTVSSMKCASTLCRVTVQHDGETARKGLANAIATTPPFDYGVYYYTAPGTKETVLYVMREGSLEH